MLPILTRYLTPEDYGIISIFTATVAIMAVFTGLSVHGAININFFKLKKEKLKEFIANTLIILNISTIIILILLFLLSDYLLPYVKFGKEWLYLAVVLSFSQFITTINLILWVAEQKPMPYSFYQLSQTTVIFSLSLLLVVGLGMGWKGEVIALALGTTIFSLISFIFIVKRGYFSLKLNKAYIKDALQFGVPLIPHALSGWFKTGADRMIVLSILGVHATGIYSVAYQMGLVLGVLVTAINKSWGPYLFRILSNSPTIEKKKTLVKYTYYYFIVVIIGAFAISYIMTAILPFFLGKKFIGIADLIVYIYLAFAFQGMYFMVVNYIFYEKKTHYLAYITFASSIFHLVLVYFLAQYNGLLGVSQAMVFSYLFTFLGTWYLSAKVYKMPWALWRENAK